MLNDNTFLDIKKWFSDYVKTFAASDREMQGNFDLKEQHTYRVCEEMAGIASTLLIDKDLRILAQIVALLHDVGRFEQYARYRTFVDKKSENHAELGLKIIEKYSVLNGLAADYQQLVKCAVCNHNRAEIPEEIDGAALMLSRLIRDADKLDIWKIVCEYYNKNGGGRNKAIELDLPDESTISEPVFKDVLAGRIVRNTELKSLNDFKLLQLAWVFDLNFGYSLEQFRNRGYLQVIAGKLTDREKSEQIVFEINKFVERRLRISG